MKKIAMIAVLASFAIGCGAEMSNATKKDIQRRVQSQNNAFERCYEEALETDDQTTGHVTLVFLVTPDGKFRQVRVARSTVNDSRLEQCVVAWTRGLRTDSEVAVPVAVTYRLNFIPVPDNTGITHQGIELIVRQHCHPVEIKIKKGFFKGWPFSIHQAVL